MREFRWLDNQIERVFDILVDLTVMADLAGLFAGRAFEICDQFIADFKVGNVPSANEGFFASKIDLLHGNLLRLASRFLALRSN
jgi:hypothetical protein